MVDIHLVRMIFNSATIQRWNDHLRSIDLVELDKQAHKAMIALVIAKTEEIEHNKSINYIKLIEASIFEFLRNIVLTDIKRPVYSFLLRNSEEDINKFVISQYEGTLKKISNNFFGRFTTYLTNRSLYQEESQILRVASNIATHWEYQLLIDQNRRIHDVESIEKNLEHTIQDYISYEVVARYLNKVKPYDFINLCGQLRFQTRWAQSPRIPATSVLGHLFLTAVLEYFLCNELGLAENRIENAFIGALFHDLPEALTRDIISPVKNEIPHLDKKVKEYELKCIFDSILPMLQPYFHKWLEYYVIDEFKTKIFEENTVKVVSVKEIETKYGDSKFRPYDGQLVKIIDHFAAYLEAVSSISYGVSSNHLIDGAKRLYTENKDLKIGDIFIGNWYRELYSDIEEKIGKGSS